MRAEFALFLALSACGPIRLSPRGDGGVDQEGDAAPVTSDAAPTSALDGRTYGCAADPLTKVVLCARTPRCPELEVDPDLFPHCGFRSSRDLLDLECGCNGELCPMGVATTCEEAERLIRSQSEMLVCAQSFEGRCVRK